MARLTASATDPLAAGAAGTATGGAAERTAPPPATPAQLTGDKAFLQALASVQTRNAAVRSGRATTPPNTDTTTERSLRTLAGLQAGLSRARQADLTETMLSRGYAADGIRGACAATVSRLYTRLAAR